MGVICWKNDNFLKSAGLIPNRHHPYLLQLARHLNRKRELPLDFLSLLFFKAQYNIAIGLGGNLLKVEINDFGRIAAAVFIGIHNAFPDHCLVKAEEQEGGGNQPDKIEVFV